MRKITKQAVDALLSSRAFKSGNTRVYMSPDCATMYLHGNAIARVTSKGVYVSCGGYASNTTKERLNGLMRELDLGYIYHKDYVWYFNDGSLFDTEGWNKIK